MLKPFPFHKSITDKSEHNQSCVCYGFTNKFLIPNPELNYCRYFIWLCPNSERERERNVIISCAGRDAMLINGRIRMGENLFCPVVENDAPEVRFAARWLYWWLYRECWPRKLPTGRTFLAWNFSKKMSYVRRCVVRIWGEYFQRITVGNNGDGDIPRIRRQ